MRKSISLTCLRRPFRQGLEWAARAGAQGVEFDGRYDIPIHDLSTTGVRQIRKWLADCRLQIACLSFPTRRGLYVSDDLDRRLEAIRKAMLASSSLGCGNVSLRLNGWPSESSDEMATLKSALSELTAYSLRAGAWIQLRIGPEPITAVRKLLDMMPEEALGIDFDPAELLIHGQDPTAAATELSRMIHHVRVRDAVRRSQFGRGTEVQLGRGEIDYAHLLGTLEENRYRGYFTVGNAHSENDPLLEAQQALEYLDHISA
ncbi:MAG TPA: sugar phosphate isomerase/epimerase family protein [Pirellulaceae bacterium]|nr:sugar phosphate isomerase/epimerase family protein [Pirellulaceae bacterium]